MTDRKWKADLQSFYGQPPAEAAAGGGSAPAGATGPTGAPGTTR